MTNIKHLLFLLLGFLLFSPTLLAKVDFSVSPGVLEFDLDDLKTQSFMIMNTGDETLRVMIQPIYYPINSRFLAAGEPLSSKPIEDSLLQDIVLSPRVLSLKPGQKRLIRVSINPIVDAKPGDYRIHLLVKKMEGENKPETLQKSDGIEIKLNISMETAIAVYARKGQGEIPLEWECKKNDKGQLALEVINKSPWRFSGWMELTDTSAQAPTVKTRLISLRQSRRTYLLAPPYPKEFRIRWGYTEDDLTLGLAGCQAP